MQENFATYLNDHMAGSVAAVGLIDDLLAGNIDASLKSVLTVLKREIGDEQNVLRKIMAAYSIKESPAKKGLAWVVEKLSTVKLGGKTDTENCLPVVQSLEVLYLGVTGKLLGWNVCGFVFGAVIEDLGIDLEQLQSRAAAQRSSIEEHRLHYAKRAFAS